MKVRALTFRKRFATIKHENRWWATLGHTDEMEVSDLKDMTLADISKFNNTICAKDSANAYHPVVYLIDSGLEDGIQLTDNAIWSEDDLFLSVTRLHFPDTTNLKAHFEELKIHIGKLASDNAYRNVSWRVYYTMELSDMVLISKSKSFQALSRWSLLSTKCKVVGKAYTYFCIPGKMLDDSPIKITPEIERDYIDFVAVRFAIRDFRADKELFAARELLGTEYTNPPYRVAGNEDAIISGQNVPVLNILKLYKTWYQDDTLFPVFRDISTRIGSKWDRIPPKPLKRAPNEQNQKKLEKYTRLVAEKVQEKVISKSPNGITADSKEWMRPLVELTNALVHMSSSATLDEPVFQILPGINAFWDNIIAGSEQLQDEPLYLRFAELCVQTMEHLMRAEGQLSQRLEVRPLAYDIPVFVLEYVTTYLLTLSHELNKPDGNDAEKIYFLLVPCAEKDVSTVEPFRSNGTVPGLLVITVPFSLLYKPKQLFPALSHELSHYVGEKLRMRKERYDFFLNCAAIELVNSFFSNLSGDIRKLNDFIKETLLDESLREWAVDLIQNYGDFYKIPLLKIVDQIELLANALLDTEKYTTLLREYVLSDKHGAQFYSLPEETRKDRLIQFTRRIRDISISFRETYADICMIHFLKLSPVEYFEVAVRQLDNIRSSTFLRIYVILSNAGYTLGDIQKAFNDWAITKQIKSSERMRAQTELKVFSDRIHSEEDNTEKFLAEYISACWNEFDSQCPLRGCKTKGYNFSANNIYQKMLKLDTTTSYQEILEVIDNGRQIVLNQLKSSK